jgi:DNA replication protein DnaC
VDELNRVEGLIPAVFRFFLIEYQADKLSPYSMQIGCILSPQFCIVMNAKNADRPALATFLKECYQLIIASAYDHKPIMKHELQDEFCKVLKFTPLELMILAATYHYTREGRCITVRALAELVNKSADFDEVDSTVDGLLRLGVLDHNRGRNRVTDDAEYGPMVKRKVMNHIRKNEEEELASIKPVGLTGVLEYARQKLFDHDMLSLQEAMDEINYLKMLNPELTIFMDKEAHLDSVEEYIILAICAGYYTEQAAVPITYFRRYLQYCRAEISMVLHEIQSGLWGPMKRGFIVIKGEQFMDEEFSLELTPEGISHFMPELPDQFKKRRQALMNNHKLPKGTLLPDQINKVKLLFDDEMLPVVNDLRALVKPTFFKEYKKSLAPADRMRGITVLLHGHPGTGKTELALQLARESKRPLIEVNVANILSKWVGESEQNTRKLFRDYDRLMDQQGREPILFLNECDGLLSRRMEVNHSVDRMNNAMQNIVLDELERFRGILLATTNMTRNLDAAFERRFLYKVYFRKPSHGLLVRLWKLSIPRLHDADAAMLAERFPYTPGEMRNVARKVKLRHLLGNGKGFLDTVIALCQEERWTGSNEKPLGFKHAV